MSFQNLNRLPIIDQLAPLTTYTVDRDIYGSGPDEVEHGVTGWFVIQHSAIDGSTYIWPVIYPSAAAAHEAIAAA